MPEWVSDELSRLTSSLGVEVILSDSGNPRAPKIGLEIDSEEVRLHTGST